MPRLGGALLPAEPHGDVSSAIRTPLSSSAAIGAMLSHMKMRHMVLVSSPVDVMDKLAVMKRFNNEHAHDRLRNCAFADARLVRAARALHGAGCALRRAAGEGAVRG